jgi:hypothetical protein
MTRSEHLCGCYLAAFLLVLCWSDPAYATAVIIEPPTKEIAVKEGGTVELVCTSSENVTWIVGGVPIQPDEGRVEVSVENVTRDALKLRNTLTIRKLRATDSGTYQCKEVSDILNEDKAQVDVTVTKLEKLQIEEAANTTELHINASDSLNLRCVGQYRSQPTWFHDGKKLEDDELLGTSINFKEQPTDNRKTSMLSRFNATSKFSGRYQCIDARKFQSDSDVLTVLVGAQSRTTASGILLTMCIVLIAAVSRLLSD